MLRFEPITYSRTSGCATCSHSRMLCFYSCSLLIICFEWIVKNPLDNTNTYQHQQTKHDLLYTACQNILVAFHNKSCGELLVARLLYLQMSVRFSGLGGNVIFSVVNKIGVWFLLCRFSSSMSIYSVNIHSSVRSERKFNFLGR